MIFILLGDEVSGLSVSIRERDDLIQIWNTNSRLADQSKITQHVKKLLTGVQFYTVFYTGQYQFSHQYFTQCSFLVSINVLINIFCPQ